MRRRTLLAAIGGTITAGGVAGTARAAETSAGSSAAAGAAAGEQTADPAGTAASRTGARKKAADPYARKVASLLRRMTTAEKLGQLQQLSWNGDTGPGGGQNDQIEEAARKGLLGSVLNLRGAKNTNALQKIAVTQSRLGIPLLFGLDVIHGFWTTFPIPLGQAASFDPGTARQDGEVAAREARSNGVHWAFAPMMDVTREPRWGRIAEGNGEDPYLTAQFAVAKVDGYQGKDLSDRDRLAACAKHYVSYGGAEGGREYNTVDLSETRLRNLYLPPYRAVVDAGVATVMASFNTISGVPAHGNAHTLTEILKDQWGFGGFVVSDYDGVHELVPHGFAADDADAAALALNAGVDMEMVSTTLADHGEDLLADGRIHRDRLDDAVARILRLKFRLGLFDNPYTDEDAEITGPTDGTRAAARTVAARSMVLLKNDGGVLPLAKSAKSVAVVGPYGDSTDLQGTWAGPGAGSFPSVTVLDGVRAAAPDADVRYAKGVDPQSSDTSGIKDAVAAAKAADVTVVVVGEPPALSGEASSRSEIGLPGVQSRLVEAVAATGKPFAVVVVCGRPLTTAEWVGRAPAVLVAWHPGIEAGSAVADVLFGRVNPGGKLPVSFPRAVGQIPIYYNHENTGRPYDPSNPDNKYVSKYLDLPDGPQFAFGHGLSYTTFKVGAPTLSTAEIDADALRGGRTVTVSVTVENTGDRAGDEVVQVYVHDLAASVVQPVRRLRGFSRVTLGPGESTTVRFHLGEEDLGFWTSDPEGRLVVEKGAFDIYAGSSSEATAKAALTVT